MRDEGGKDRDTTSKWKSTSPRIRGRDIISTRKRDLQGRHSAKKVGGGWKAEQAVSEVGTRSFALFCGGNLRTEDYL